MYCFVADTLSGSSPLSSRGRRSASLDPNSVAALASSSTASLPLDPICPATQVSVIEAGLLMKRLFRFPSFPASTNFPDCGSDFVDDVLGWLGPVVTDGLDGCLIVDTDADVGVRLYMFLGQV